MKEPRDTDERELLRLTAGGDKSAFTQLFQHHHRKLAAFVFHLTKSTETAEEIVLDVFLKIWMSRETLSAVKHFDAYLFIMARNDTECMPPKKVPFTISLQ